MFDTGTSPGKWWRLLITLLSVAVVLAMLAAACGGDDDENGDDGDDGAPTATERAEDGDAEEGEGDQTADAGDAASALEALSGDYEDVVAKVSYDFTTTSDGTITTTSMTIYSRPPDSRTDFADSDTGETTSFISSGGETYICSAEQCIAYPAGGGLNPIPFVSEYVYPSAIRQLVAGYRGIDIDQTEEEIAGIDATCFAVTEGGTEVSWCFGDNGLLLRSATESAGGSFEMEATNVDLEVSDEDFEPPYPVATIPGL